MTSLILFGGGVLFALSAVGFLLYERRRMKQEGVVIDISYNGPEHVSVAVHAIIRFLLKKSIHIRKFVMQYFFHILVRGMYHFDILTTKLYALSRNWFVKNAVRNKGTVPHFWEHLKVYKQEMDKEKEEEKWE